MLLLQRLEQGPMAVALSIAETFDVLMSGILSYWLDFIFPRSLLKLALSPVATLLHSIHCSYLAVACFTFALSFCWSVLYTQCLHILSFLLKESHNRRTLNLEIRKDSTSSSNSSNVMWFWTHKGTCNWLVKSWNWMLMFDYAFVSGDVGMARCVWGLVLLQYWTCCW